MGLLDSSGGAVLQAFLCPRARSQGPGNSAPDPELLVPDTWVLPESGVSPNLKATILLNWYGFLLPAHPTDRSATCREMFGINNNVSGLPLPSLRVWHCRLDFLVTCNSKSSDLSVPRPRCQAQSAVKFANFGFSVLFALMMLEGHTLH